MLDQNQENNLEKNNLQPVKSSRSVSLMMGVVCVLVSIFVYSFYLKPLRSDVSAFESELSTVENNVSFLESKIESFRDAEAKLNITSDVAKDLALSAIPSSLEQDEVIRDVVEIARSNDIELSSINFSKGGSSYPGIKSLKISSGFEGNYTDLISFLRSLEVNERFFRVNSISVQINNSDGVGLTRVNFSLSFEAYFQ